MRTLITWLVVILALAASRANGGERPTPPRGFSYDDDLPPDAANKADAESAPTPIAEVERVLGLLPEPKIALADFGCGPEARWVIAAGKKGWRAIGIEINPVSVALARERVIAEGLGHLVTIVEGDATQLNVDADVGVAFLFQGVLDRLKPRIEKLRAFASYRHRPAGVAVTQSGNSWLYFQPAAKQVVVQQPYAVWGGQVYYGPNPGCKCEMCRSIVSQIAAFPVAPAPVAQPAKPSGKWVNQQVCTFDSRGRKTGCTTQSVWVPSQ